MNAQAEAAAQIEATKVEQLALGVEQSIVNIIIQHTSNGGHGTVDTTAGTDGGPGGGHHQQ